MAVKKKKVQPKVVQPKVVEDKVEEQKIKMVFGQQQEHVLVATYKDKECVLRIPNAYSFADTYACTREMLITIKGMHEQRQKELAEQAKATQQMKNNEEFPETAEG